MSLAIQFRGKPLGLMVVALSIALGAPTGRDLPKPRQAGVSGQEMRQMIASGSLAGLRWPDFSDLRASVDRVYAQNGYKPLWIKPDGRFGSQGHFLLTALRNAADKGLEPEDYDAALLMRWSSERDHEGRADLGLTIAVMRYASALHEGRVDPRQVRFAITPKQWLDPAPLVMELQRLPENQLAARMAQLEPPFRRYRQTEAALRDYRQRAAREPVEMPKRPRLPLKPGQRYDDMPALAARLALLGDGKTPAEGERRSVYEGEMVEGVKRFQAQHGLPADGTVGKETWRALTTPLAQRVEQLALTLERWRWIPETVYPAIVVNIPEFELRAYENRRMVLRMHVIVGKAYRHHTPVFEDELQSVIVRPYWNVPLSIQVNEIVPAMRKNAGYLARHDMMVVDQRRQPVGGMGRQELLGSLASGAVRLQQRPGPENSLGLLKFDFPNAYDVYMHGTPVQQLFARARRDFSHGCIRVADPLSLAEWVLRGQEEWTRERILEATAGDQTLEIPVRRKIAVLILYGTAVVEDEGQVHFYDDLYGLDAELRKALDHGYPYPHMGRAAGRTVGTTGREASARPGKETR